MFSSVYCRIFILLIIGSLDIKGASMTKEHVCTQFQYDEQLLEKMIRTEIKVEAMVNEIKNTEGNVLSSLGEMKQTIAEFVDKFEILKENISKEMAKKGKDIKRKEGTSNT